MKGLSKKGQMWQTLIPYIIGFLFLVLAVILYLILSGNMQGVINWLKNLVRFGK